MTRTTIRAAVVALALVALATPARAQEGSGSLFKSPVFVLQPGVITSGAVSCSGCAQTTKANLRFATIIPTISPWVSLVGGAQWGPQKDAHGAIIFYGAIVPIKPLNDLTQNWLSFSIDPLGVTTGSGSEGTNFYLEGAVVFNVGRMMTNMGKTWAGTGIYFLMDQQMSSLPVDAAGNKDRFSPGLVYGVTIPIAQ